MYEELDVVKRSGKYIMTGLVPYYDPAKAGSEFKRFRAHEDGTIDIFYERFAVGSLKPRRNVKCLIDHNDLMKLGETIDGSCQLKEERSGWRFENPLSRKNPMHRTAYEMWRDNQLKGSSHGFYAKAWEWDDSDPNKIVKLITEAEFDDIGPCPFPCYTASQAEMSVRSQSIKRSLEQEFEKDWLDYQGWLLKKRLKEISGRLAK